MCVNNFTRVLVHIFLNISTLTVAEPLKGRLVWELETDGNGNLLDSSICYQFDFLKHWDSKSREVHLSIWRVQLKPTQIGGFHLNFHPKPMSAQQNTIFAMRSFFSFNFFTRRCFLSFLPDVPSTLFFYLLSFFL